MSSLRSLINSVLSNLEEAAIFLHLEVVVASLLDRRPLMKQEAINIHLTKAKRQVIFINNAQPKYRLKLRKMARGKRTITLKPTGAKRTKPAKCPLCRGGPTFSDISGARTSCDRCGVMIP